VCSSDLAGKILGNPRWAVRWTKMTANITLKQIMVSLSDAAVAYESLSNLTADRKEAVNAFRERRPMNLTGE
jgi:enoyl-CoA hydratase